jgi:hypothetical protein
MVGAACSGGERSLLAKQGIRRRGGILLPFPPAWPLPVCSQPTRSSLRSRPGGREEGSRRGLRRRWRGPAAGRTSSRLCPSLWFVQVVGEPPPPPSTGRFSHRRGCRTVLASPVLVRGRPVGTLRHRPARGCSPLKTKDDGELLPAATERSCCSAACTLELFLPDRGGAGSDTGPNPFGTKMRPEQSLGT